LILRAGKFGCVSLALSLAEILVIWGGVAIGRLWHQHNWQCLGNAFLHAFLVAGIGSVVFAVLGLVKDTRRTLALVALVLAVANFGICALPLTG
jgi:hypothetical protein